MGNNIVVPFENFLEYAKLDMTVNDVFEVILNGDHESLCKSYPDVAQYIWAIHTRYETCVVRLETLLQDLRGEVDRSKVAERIQRCIGRQAIFSVLDGKATSIRGYFKCIGPKQTMKVLEIT